MGPCYCNNLTVSASYCVSLLFAWLRLCQDHATCAQPHALARTDSLRARVGNLLPSKSHLDPFTTARRPMRARIILRSMGHKCFPKKKKRSSPVVRVIDLSIISYSLASKNSKRAADGRQKSHMRLRSRGLPTYGLE